MTHTIIMPRRTAGFC